MKNEAARLKAIADVNRLQIIEMLSCGEMCACDIIKGLKLTQPTISHHMKILQTAGLVNSEKRGKWIFYSIDQTEFNQLSNFINTVSTESEDCICKTIEKSACNE